MSLKTERQIGTIAYMGGIMSLLEPFAFAWGNMLVYTHEAMCGPCDHIHIDRARLSLHDKARNELIQRMKGDWILMLDTDVLFEPDLACRMVACMQRHDVDVLTGIYSVKAPPHGPVLWWFNPETEKHEQVVDWDRESEIFQVSAAGAGCLLVRRSVFEKIVGELKENPFDRTTYGEDFGFFMRCRKLGIPVYCAWKIEVQHLEYVGLSTARDFKPPKPEHTFDVQAARPRSLSAAVEERFQ